MREIPLKTCPACAGDWFREADHYAFFREESKSVGPSWPTWPDLVGQLSMAPMPLLVCLCGRPWRPEIAGVRGERTFNLNLAQLLDGLENNRPIPGLQDGDSSSPGAPVPLQHLPRSDAANN